MPTVLKSGSLKLLEPSGPVQACNGIAFLSYTGSKILLYTFLSKMFICFLSLFVSFQVSDACVNVLSIIVFFSLKKCNIDVTEYKNAYEGCPEIIQPF